MSIEQSVLANLDTQESKEKYLSILSQRIDENKKLQGRLFLIMLISVISFPLLLETKISQISFGPIKLEDTRVAIMLLPTIFAYAFYQYQTVLNNLSKQRVAYEILASNFFEIPKESILTRIIKPYSIAEAFSIH